MNEDKKLELQYKYAWDWFQYHAQQRLVAFRYFLIIVGALFVGYQKCLEENGQPKLKLFICLFGFLFSFAFYFLEIRNEELVNCGRDSLDKIEKDIGLTIREDDENRKHLKKPWLLKKLMPEKWFNLITKHKFWFRVIYLISGFIFLYLII